MLEYIAKSFSVFFVGFFPFAEIYVAVPAGFALGLDPASVIVWSIVGNFLPVLLIQWFHDVLLRIPRFGPWLGGLASEKVKDRLDRHGFWFVVLATPWIGVWVVAAVLRLLDMDPRKAVLSILIGVVGYAVVIAGLIMAGVELASG
ncbi:MAG: small multi-drug export protein [Candidatus Sumerlaeia bacterium]|nr:small multi-drug export protein [Candidatus Sumerlaeia bacterium]